jgi:multiple sugar transport system permease protein/raffinose/stachyose/melibiose transport system permease protein
VTIRNAYTASWRYTLLLVLVVLTLFPIWLMLATSLKNNVQFYDNFLGLTLPFRWANYRRAWLEISPYILNSFIVTIVTVAGVVAFSALAAYAFARLRFLGKEILYYMMIALMMLPGILTMVPQFVLVKNLGLLDSLWALILPYISGGVASGGVAFAIFVLRSFFASLPDELFQAARIDGASELQVFWRLGVPLIRPALATVAILQTLSTWNDFIWPSATLYTNALFTLPVGLVSFQGNHLTDWGPLMAGYTIASLPLVLLFAFSTRTFIEGMIQGGLKL